MANKYIVVTPNKIVHFDSHKEAFDNYETQPKPCGVYEVSTLRAKSGEVLGDSIYNLSVVYAVNVKAEFHGDSSNKECFIHLHNMLNANNYKESTR